MTNTPTSREAFEKWYVENISGCNGEWIEKIDNGQYYEISTNKAWEAWQASQAQQEALIAELVEALEMWAGLINYQYTGSKEAMSALQICDDFGQEVLAKVKGK